MTLLEISIYVALLTMLIFSYAALCIDVSSEVPNALAELYAAGSVSIAERYLDADMRDSQTIDCDEHTLIIEHPSETITYALIDQVWVRTTVAASTTLFEHSEMASCDRVDRQVIVTVLTPYGVFVWNTHE